MSLTYSPIAQRVSGVRDPKLGRLRTPWGYLLHTTGGGITALARKTGKKPIEVALKCYIDSQNGSNGYTWGGPTYVINHDGQIYQIAPDEVMTAHAGSGNRPFYLDGSWITKCSVAASGYWRKAWPGKAHPYALFPSKSPNVDYVGVEMIPIGDGFGGAPMRPGLRFTEAQHGAAITLGKNLAQRFGFPEGWANTGRLVGHEDVDPIERHDTRGGWDPGFLRAAPYFDLAYVRAGI